MTGQTGGATHNPVLSWTSRVFQSQKRARSIDAPTMTRKFQATSVRRPRLRRLLAGMVAVVAVTTACPQQPGAAGDDGGQTPGFTKQLRQITDHAAENRLRANRRRHPKDPDTHMWLAKFLMGQAEHRNEVIGLALQAASLDPDNASRWTFVAEAYENARKPEGAIDAATKAIELDPNAAEPHVVRARAREAMMDLDGAVADLKEAARIDPSKADYPFQAGRISGRKRDWAASAEFLTKAIDLGWKGVNAHAMLGQSLARSGDKKGGMAVLDKLVADRPNEAGAWSARGDLHAENKEFEKALSDYRHASELDPSSINYLNAQGWVLGRQRRATEAVACFDKVIAMKPGDVFAHAQRGFMKELLGKFPEAADDFGRAIELDPGYPGYLRSRGVARFAAGDFKEALDDFTQYNSRNGRSQDYTWFMIFLLKWQLEGTQDATHVKEVALNAKEPWTRTVAKFLAGEISEEEFLGSAGKGDDEQSRGERCESYFYSGVVRGLRGQDGVRDLFFKCIAVGKWDFIENTMARGELQRMGETLLPPAEPKPDGQNG